MSPFTLVGIDVVLFLAIGILAGAHCIGMCGPLVTVYAGRMAEHKDGRRERAGHLTTYEVRQHALFNVGRAASYTLLGAGFGALGGLLFVATDTFTAVTELVRGGVGVLIGAFVIAIGVRYLLGRISPGIHLPGLERVTGWLTARVDRLANGPGILGLGAIHGLLPCPILYPAFLYAFATGSAAAGAVALAALGIGTIPAVFAYGTIIDSVDITHRRRVHRLLGVAFIVLGYVLFAHGLMSVGIHLPHPELPFYDPLDSPSGGHEHH